MSWRILVPDLAAAWEAIANEQEPALPARGTSFRRWAQRLAVEAQDARRVGELSFWTGMLSEPSLSLIEGALDPDRDTSGTARHLTLTLPAVLTGALLTRVPAAFHGGINDVLLTGLVVAIADWCRRRGRGASQGSNQAVLLDLEGHGREDIFADVDLSRTVGWFTSLFPVRLDPGALDLDEAWRAVPRSGARSRPIKEQLRALPDNGLGYGLLRYLNRETASQLAGLAAPQIGFNYLGRFAAAAADWGAAPEAVRLGGGDRHAARPCARGQRAHARRCRGTEAHGDLVVGACAVDARLRFAIWRERWFAGAGGAGAPCVGSPAPADAARPICRWLRSRRARSSGWRASTRRSRTSCRCRRCRKGCCSTRSTTRRRRTSTRSSWSSGLEGPLDGDALQAAAQALVAAPCEPARGLPARGPQPAGADHRAAGDAALAQHRSVLAG